VNYGTPIGGSISGTGTFGGYGGILAALMQHYGQGGQAQAAPAVDETALAQMLGLAPKGIGLGAQPLPHPNQPMPGGIPQGNQGPVPDFSGQYNTDLGGAEPQFQQWLQQLGKAKGYDASMDLRDYDLRGAFKGGATADARGHLTDEWKKPNHPTFSDQSIYSGKDGYEGGQWVGDDAKGWDYQATKTNMQFRNKRALNNYFRQVEPDSKVRFPTPGGGPVVGIGLGR
jgi:hypothetical protein